MKKSKNANKITFSEYSHYILYNTSNYKSSIEKSVLEILNKFIDVIVEYIHIILEKRTIKNEIYNDFIFERGLDTLKHVFLIIFYYTKNLDLTFYHTQKAYYFYIEFIEQITDDNVVTFLRLGSRDAIMFVYKRTIFELNNEFKKDMEEPNFSEKNIFKTIDTFIPIYKDIVLYVMKYYDANNDNKKNINTFYQSIKNINEILCKSKNNNQIECLHIFITLLHDKKMETVEYFKLLDNFIKNLINKKKNNEKDIKVKMYDPETINFINNNDSNIIVNYIFDIS
jgi:hypothetical protein